MSISYLGEGNFTYNDGIMTTSIVFFEPISLYGKIGNQSFSYGGNLDKKEILAYFSSRDKILKSALHHKRGVINKTAVLRNADMLEKEGILSYEKAKTLIEFIKPATCAPARIVQKLIRKGYREVIPRLEIYQEIPMLTDTVDTFQDFLKELETYEFDW